MIVNDMDYKCIKVIVILIKLGPMSILWAMCKYLYSKIIGIFGKNLVLGGCLRI